MCFFLSQKAHILPYVLCNMYYLRTLQYIYKKIVILPEERLKQIRIGTTSKSPSELPPSVGNIKVCAQKDSGTVSGTEAFPCGATDRFVVVILEYDDAILTLCEVEVFGSKGGYIS